MGWTSAATLGSGLSFFASVESATMSAAVTVMAVAVLGAACRARSQATIAFALASKSASRWRMPEYSACGLVPA